MSRKVLFIAFMSWVSLTAKTQVCLVPGQTPSSAILVCGSATFFQNTPSLCGETDVPVPCNDGATYQNVNPNFFRMACFSSGTLGFLITPTDLTANYNWQLFDITGINPFDIFTNPSLFVASNWSTTPGETGASQDGINISECSNSPLAYSSMPTIIQGRTYLLMVSNKSASGGSYQLTFTGGSASITDPLPPQLLSTTTNCDATKINVALNKGILCSSVASDGSDFRLSGGIAITGATIGACTQQGLIGLVTLSLAQPLPPGNYTLTMTNGSDGNTLIDLCGFSVADGENIGVISAPPQPTLADSVKPTGCKPSYIELVFKRLIRCNSIAPDGSDFIISGPQAVTHTVSVNNCFYAFVSVIRLNLSAPLLTGGVYTVQLKNGTDGNTLVDECGLLSPPGSVSFSVTPSVSAAFNYSIRSSCKNDTLLFSHNGHNGVTSWRWKFDTASVTGQNHIKIYSDTLPHTVRLIVTNGNCSDTSIQTIKLQNKIKAAFTGPVGVCPGDMISLASHSIGNITNWQWDLGNNMTSYLPVPPLYQYPVPNGTVTYHVRLITSNNVSGCSDTAIHSIIAKDECPIMVPTGFTPNNDGLNDYLGLLNTSKAEKPEFKVYNRAGQLVFASNTIIGKWDGKINGIPADSGLFVWMLSYTNRDNGKRIFLKGTTMLIR